MDRAAIFAAVKAARADKPWTRPDIEALDRVLDHLGVPRVESSPALSPSRACYEIIKEFESCELEAYPDPGTGGDPWTIGWGATGPGIRKGVRWTQEMADSRLKADVARFADTVAEGVKGGAATSQNEFDAMVSLAYNIGQQAFRDSTLLKKHRAGDKPGATAQFGKWVNSGGKKLKGLVRRRAAEALLYAGGA